MTAKIRHFIGLILLVGILFHPVHMRAADEEKDIQTIIHLLDYIAKDYPGAVHNSKVINEVEYQEMLDFAKIIIKLSEENEVLSSAEGFSAQLQHLLQQIEEKKSPNKIAEIATNLRSDVVQITGYKAFPEHWPDLENGKIIYNQSCVACHGPKGIGDGILAKNLNPPPSNFLDPELMKNLSPFQAFNSIRLGISGTAMPAFPELTDEEVWDLAFYVKSLESAQATINSEEVAALFPSVSDQIPLAEVASLNDHQIKSQFNLNGKALAALRMHSGEKLMDDRFLDIAKQNIKSSVNAYKEKDFKLARQFALAAYLDGIEPIESRLMANDAKFTAAIESSMLELRLAIEERHPIAQLQEVANNNLELITQADELLEGNELNFWLSLLLSASIILREGLEAFLIIAVIVAVIKRSGNTKALPWLHGGWVAALLLGYVGWHFSGWILEINGKNRELMEGGIALSAVVILTVVGFWLHNNSHAKQWKIFIEEKIKKLLHKENMFGLAFFSFIVVFREAIESVLFLQAIKLETAVENQSAIGLGVLTAFVVIGFLMVLFVKFSKKLPVRQMFRYSAWMITLFAVILIGKGIHSIQESGVFSVTQIPFDFRMEWAGIYPTLESLLAQVLLLTIILSLWFFQSRKMKLNT